MKITSTKRAARIMKNPKEAEKLFRNPKGDFLELEAPDEQTCAVAVSRLSELSTVLSSSGVRSSTYRVEINIAGTPEGLSAAQAILANLGRCAIEMPPSQEEIGSTAELPAWVVPTAGGMALGFTGGLGLGMVLSAVRSSAAASGNPVINGLAVGLGLVGTAAGAYVGATGARISGIKFPGGSVTFSQQPPE